MSFDLFSWSEMWKVAGPFLIMAIVALLIGVVCAIVMLIMPKGLMRELFRIISIVAIVGGALGSLYIAAGIWGYV